MKKNRTNKSTHIGQIWTERLLIQLLNKKINSKKTFDRHSTNEKTHQKKTCQHLMVHNIIIE